MNNNAKAKAKAFLTEFHLSKVTTEDLRRIITGQGYTIVEFNNVVNDPQVAMLINALGLQEMIGKSRGFTYADRQSRIVFVHEDLSEKEKLLVLAHEEGHIYCDHFSAAPVLGRDVVQEHEANEFTHYILHRNVFGRIGGFVKENKKLCRNIAIVLAAALIITAAVLFIQKQRSYYGDFYVTSTGNRYHEKECIFVKNKSNVHRLTIEEFEEGGYTPCNTCLPPEQPVPTTEADPDVTTENAEQSE